MLKIAPEIEVCPGDIFHVGPHRFLCADIEEDIDYVNMLNVPRNIHMVYSDPPWNPGNARMWRTMSKLDGDSGRKVVWCAFVERFARCVNSSHPKHVFIEMGIKQTPGYINMARIFGMPELQGLWSVFYNYMHPNRLLYFADTDGFTGNPEGMKNEPMTRHVFEHIAKPGEVVFDPCVGLGMTARMAHQYDMICYGIELNPARLARTLGWLAKRGYDVEKI